MCYGVLHEAFRPSRRGGKLRPNLSVYLERVVAGEVLEVTDRGRAVARSTIDSPAAMGASDRAVDREAMRVLRAINLLRLDDGIIAAAAAIKPMWLRSFDALHLATAHAFGHQLAGMVVYDQRLASAARDHGLTVWAPE